LRSLLPKGEKRFVVRTGKRRNVGADDAVQTPRLRPDHYHLLDDAGSFFFFDPADESEGFESPDDRGWVG
jgi:hypothetical protein